MKQVWKRRAVAAAVVVLVGTSVYLNWRYAGDVADTSKVLGQSTLVNGRLRRHRRILRIPPETTISPLPGSAASRPRYRHQYAGGGQGRGERLRGGSQRGIRDASGAGGLHRGGDTDREPGGGKGYADCVAFMGADSISVVVSAPDGLEAEDVAKIKDIVIAETSYTPGQIKIMEAGTSGAK